MGNTYTGSDVGKGGLEVTEVDGTPDVRGVTKITVSNATLTDDGGGAVTILTGGGGAGGNTLDQAYDQGGAGLGRTIDADSGSVLITVSNTDNNPVLELTQNDTTNNPQTLIIANTGSGDTLNIDNAIGHVFTISNSEVVVNEQGVDVDFRVETTGSTTAFVIDAGADTATYNVLLFPDAGINTFNVGGFTQFTPFDQPFGGGPANPMLANPQDAGGTPVDHVGWIAVTGTNSKAGAVYIPVWAVP